ncbi:hypothetical protein AVEN_227556-1 [Araneus ventricosus]|uniref:Uncharacterized protein n=1 Tax=Araneus ventricosus TaxID=182803 RepID=A0A4Y2C3Y6_ARAVE|nr:hypothetical protein AVEN_227556-1 [Araneus ventricosus]
MVPTRRHPSAQGIKCPTVHSGHIPATNNRVNLAPLDKDCTAAVAPEEDEVSPSTSQIDVSIQLVVPLLRHEQ